MEDSTTYNNPDHNLYLFDDAIEPMWEDKANASGGALSLMFEKNKSDRIWENLLLAFVSDSSEDAKSINGIRLKIRKDIASIEIWISFKPTETAKFDRIYKWVTDAIGLKEDTHIDFSGFY
jgi:hypothetical protein